MPRTMQTESPAFDLLRSMHIYYLPLLPGMLYFTHLLNPCPEAIFLIADRTKHALIYLYFIVAAR